MTEGGSTSPVDEMRQYIRRQVAAGYLDADEVEQSAIDCFVARPRRQHLDPALLKRIAGVETDKAFAAQLDAQRQWPAVTDCDRLDHAFADLNRRGIVARQNFACCYNCGHAEIGEEVDDGRESGTKVIGYTFFHSQGTEGAVAYGRPLPGLQRLAGDEARWCEDRPSYRREPQAAWPGGRVERQLRQDDPRETHMAAACFEANGQAQTAVTLEPQCGPMIARV